MKNRSWIILLILFTSISVGISQDGLYTSINFKKAYDNGTRSINGEPGENYWQNRADYDIKVELDPQNRTITGRERIYYQNNSPDSLNNLYLKIYQDIYKIGTLRDIPMDSSDIHHGTEVQYILINGDSVKISGDDSKILRTATVLRLKLEEPLSPGDDLNLDLGWETSLPGTTRLRMGAYGDSAFFVAHWFPRIAVYDDIDGWDINPYSGIQEFYNDFGDFDVEITVPGDFIVWATGLLQNMDEVLDEKYIDRFEEASSSDSVIQIVTSTDYLNGPVPIQNKNNVWRYKALYVPDFAFATSNCYLWDATSLTVDEDGDRRVVVDVAYRAQSEELYDVAKIARESIKYLSSEMPAYPFPYPKLTVFNGSGGMEFPMMVNDGTTTTRASTIGLTAHEIAHTYFPFFMGTNEKKYAWMDEGWAVMLIFDLQNRTSNGTNQIQREIRTYYKIAGQDLDLPMMIPSLYMRGTTYRVAAYSRPSIAYHLLREVMGDKKFIKALHLYMDCWNGKHPIPYDFFYTFDQVNGESLAWFWIPWFFEQGYVDLAIKEVKTSDDKTEVAIEKIGQLPVPIKAIIVYSDESKERITYSAEVWKENSSEYRFIFDHEKQIDRIEIGDQYIPDINQENNTYQK
jgi:hypothetical protein